MKDWAGVLSLLTVSVLLAAGVSAQDRDGVNRPTEEGCLAGRGSPIRFPTFPLARWPSRRRMHQLSIWAQAREARRPTLSPASGYWRRRMVAPTGHFHRPS